MFLGFSLFLVKLSSIMPLIQVQELSRMMLQHILCFSFFGPWDPSQGLYNPGKIARHHNPEMKRLSFGFFFPGCHSSISDTAQASVSKLRDARYRARAILENPTDKTKVLLIYANVTYNDILLRNWSLTANYPDQFKIYYVLNQPPETWDGGVGFVSKDMIQAHCPAPASDIQVIPYPLFFLILNIPDHHFF
ncbi:hypothetical protein HID58_047030 [Brassica napus]|uniref:BnaC02g19290D protein n=2 Tax=Brassica napus TaxID=3708 RepID=A0A078GPV9_BRANA|nr:hypothetical protein HID58_047030 [Brassica napus]CAF1906300.1 unnamed protein product [Brassica napus]CDY28560.1 BnaC02g19290D [Brassica napus]